MRAKNKEITIYDIAESLNLSSATVSRGLKDHPAIRKETKKRILEKAKEMGYRHNQFASNLRQNRTNTIGVIVPRLNSYFMSSAIAGIEKVVNEAGYNLVISQSLESAKKENVNIRTMFNSRVDGLLVSLCPLTILDCAHRPELSSTSANARQHDIRFHKGGIRASKVDLFCIVDFFLV